jgi:hypothetical protein
MLILLKSRDKLPSKYESVGNAGIINIKLKRQVMEPTEQKCRAMLLENI